VNVELLAAEKTAPECLQLTTGLFSVTKKSTKIRALAQTGGLAIQNAAMYLAL